MVSRLLMIEASVDDASVAVLVEGAVVAFEHVAGRRPDTGQRSEGVAPAVARVLAQAGITSRELDGVLCSAGPGGFTSLRTAASIAKGLCFALQIPLYAVPTLELMVMDSGRRDGQYMAALEAGRGEYYTAGFEVRDGVLSATEPLQLLSREQVEDRAQAWRATVIGPPFGVMSIPRAQHVTGEMLARVLAAGPVSVEQWEPLYGRLPDAQVKWEAAHGRSLPL